MPLTKNPSIEIDQTHPKAHRDTALKASHALDLANF